MDRFREPHCTRVCITRPTLDVYQFCTTQSYMMCARLCVCSTIFQPIIVFSTSNPNEIFDYCSLLYCWFIYTLLVYTLLSRTCPDSAHLNCHAGRDSSSSVYVCTYWCECVNEMYMHMHGRVHICNVCFCLSMYCVNMCNWNVCEHACMHDVYVCVCVFTFQCWLCLFVCVRNYIYRCAEWIEHPTIPWLYMYAKTCIYTCPYISTCKGVLYL
jgi:hypothetical protein